MRKALGGVLGLAGATLVLTGCGGNQVAENSAPVAQPQAETTVAVDGTNSVATSQANSTSPDQGAAASPQALPVPNLIPPTTPGDRLPTVTVGRSEPFGAIADAPIVRRRVSVATAPSNPAPSVAVAPAPASVPAPAPQITTVPLPNQPLPILPGNSLPPVAVPGTSVAANPSTAPVSPAAPTSLANGIEVSGVIEAGGTVSAIVQVPGEPTSRYVNAGDYLAGGSVLVKRIDTTGEPIVILEQGGVEVIRSVGSSAIAGAL
ncbi:hypothetical protein H6G00_13055 [Leptolyngbya sp. FACHB-541]|uniref:hypothetical protein n=1 Tax=Leptolyngbya sp. FACHB-541 TaxID=2692810 RepID=UPI0016821882|nr:hypothetical protein [Leptolyngbya sp. FACHB-541]MBD1997544.1 hypothetical protein [Leptolyngbya sp. FACHB-541]